MISGWWILEITKGNVMCVPVIGSSRYVPSKYTRISLHLHPSESSARHRRVSHHNLCPGNAVLLLLPILSFSSFFPIIFLCYLNVRRECQCGPGPAMYDMGLLAFACVHSQSSSVTQLLSPSTRPWLPIIIIMHHSLGCHDAVELLPRSRR